MNIEELLQRLEIVPHNGGFRVNARESPILEFKLKYDLPHFKKCLKTIAAFANRNGGYIVFGVRDKPRILEGINGQEIDEGIISTHMVNSLSPPPDFAVKIVDVHEKKLAVIWISPILKPSVISLKRLEGAAGEGPMIEQGVVYIRRGGQTAPISGEEFTQLLGKRDDTIQKMIFSYFEKGKSIGFEKAIVATHAPTAENAQGMNFFIPKEAAKGLNIIDRARLVEDAGAPAYEILGTVHLTNPEYNDTRLPMRAEQSAISMVAKMEEIFWNGFKWSYWHLKKAADHLGFWENDNGDQVHTGREPLSKTTIYYANGRESILNFAKQNPKEFIEVVGSTKTIVEWKERKVQQD